MSSTDPLADRVVAWQAEHGRHDLPWQRPRDAYRVWVSETMLQQTQVATVVPYFNRFIARFPTLAALAEASLDDVLALWSGLGYYARGRHLHAAAKQVLRDHEGQLPTGQAALEALPGIGRSTAAAIRSLAFDQPAAILDGNVKRLFARYFGVQRDANGTWERTLWRHAERECPPTQAAAYTQGLMDLGALVCTVRAPACLICPLARGCIARAGDPRAFPGRSVRAPLPERHTNFVAALSGDRVLLRKRPDTGLWPGLWCLPEVEHDRLTGLHVRERRQIGIVVFRHTFTHFRMQARVRIVRVSPTPGRAADLAWHDLAAVAALALPAPIRKVLLGIGRVG